MVTIRPLRYKRPRWQMKFATSGSQTSDSKYGIRFYHRENHEELIHVVLTREQWIDGRNEVEKSPVYQVIGETLKKVISAFKTLNEDSFESLIDGHYHFFESNEIKILA